jgi:hypothetical protein
VVAVVELLLLRTGDRVGLSFLQTTRSPHGERIVSIFQTGLLDVQLSNTNDDGKG